MHLLVQRWRCWRRITIDCRGSGCLQRGLVCKTSVGYNVFRPLSLFPASAFQTSKRASVAKVYKNIRSLYYITMPNSNLKDYSWLLSAVASHTNTPPLSSLYVPQKGSSFMKSKLGNFNEMKNGGPRWYNYWRRIGGSVVEIFSEQTVSVTLCTRGGLKGL